MHINTPCDSLKLQGKRAFSFRKVIHGFVPKNGPKMTCGRVFQHEFISKANLKNPVQSFLVHRLYLLRKQKIVSGKAGFQLKSDRI